MTHKRTLLTAAAVLLLLPTMLVGGLLAVSQSEWGERFVERRASAALERAVEVDDITIKLAWPPRIHFGHLRIANPEWAETKDLINARDLYARVLVLPLFTGRVVIPDLGAAQATAGLEMDGKKATWRFSREAEEKEESGLLLERIHVGDGDIRFIDKPRATDLVVKLKGSAGEGGELTGKADGRFRNEATSIVAAIPELATQHEAPVRLAAAGTIGRTRAKVDGVLTTDGRTLDVDLDLSGQSLKDLAKVTGMVLPDSPPYRFHGHLKHAGADWHFSPFNGRIGDSDLRGDFLYRKGEGRPFLQAKLQSNLLDFDDLGPLVGAPPKTGAGETAAPEQKAKATQVKASTRALPDAEFGTTAWGRMDADVRLKAKRVQRPKMLPVESLDTHLVLRNSVLHLAPLNFGFAGGRITSDVKLDANRKPLRGDMKVDVQGLQLARLFPESKSMQDALGTLYGRAELVGHGASVASLLGTSDGKASLAVDGGRINALLVELLGLDIAESVMLLGRRYEQVELRCAVSGFEAREGNFQAESFVIDTSDTVVEVEGGINLRDERFDLETKPYPKDPSPLALRTPMNIKGTLKDPAIRPKAGPLGARVAGAIALGAIAPPLALLALVETGPGKDTDCAKLLAEARSRGAVKTAEAPGTAPRGKAKTKEVW